MVRPYHANAYVTDDFFNLNDNRGSYYCADRQCETALINSTIRSNSLFKPPITVTFVNDEADKPHPSPVMRTELAKVFKKALIEADLDPEFGTVPSVNVNSTSRDTLSNSNAKSNHARHKNNAIDINRINDQPILQTRSNRAPIATIENLQNSFENQQGIREIFGPVFNKRTEINGDVKIDRISIKL